jgi:hypothetical protein
MRRSVCLFCFGICFAAGCEIALAQTPPDLAAGPVPPEIRTNRPYNEFYAALKTAGRYQLVVAPSGADLVLELRLFAPYGPSNANKQHGASDPLPMLRLVIYDRKTHYVLWAFTESVDAAVLQRTHDRNLDNAITKIVGDFENVSGAPATP